MPEPPADGGATAAPRSGNALADRLRDAAEHAANLVDADIGSGDQLGQAVHEVRRALAAIEIDAAKRASHAVRPATPEPDDIDDNEQFGRIKFFKPEKGFGFIIPDDGGDDVFLSSKTASAAGLDNLTQGDRVRFVPGPGSKGLEAKSIERDD
jgi:CspA family cold shock protein